MKTICFILFVYAVTFGTPFVLPDLKMDRVLPFIVGLCGIVYQLTFNRGEHVSSLGFGWSGLHCYLKVFATVSLVMLSVAVAGILSGKLYLELPFRLALLKVIINIPLLTILITPLAMFTEELVFRGIIQRELGQSLSPMLSILSASVIFGIWHIPFARSFGLGHGDLVMYAAGTALVGVLAGVFYYHTNSLVTAGLLHAFWNAASYTIFGLGSEMPRILESRNDTWTHPEHGVIGLVALLCAVIFLFVEGKLAVFNYFD